VLKDEDLRKKYDMYGEDGLQEGGPTGRNYQSWSFYNQEFGMLRAHKLSTAHSEIGCWHDNVVCCLSICL